MPHNPLNWLYISYNTVEEFIRVDPNRHIVPAAMTSRKRVDGKTLEVKLRPNKFQDGEPVTVQTIRRNSDEMTK